jgi:polyhydroxybutyrate depolymerase
MRSLPFFVLLLSPRVGAIEFGKENSIEITSGNVQRKALLYLPSASTLPSSVPLVVDSHAWGSTDSLERDMTGMSNVASREGFIVVYPQGYDNADPIDRLPVGVNYAWNAGACCPEACSKKRSDVLFIKELVSYIKTVVSAESNGTIKVDDSRIYAMGMSNGAFFTNRLGCEARELFAAIAPVSGMIVNGSSPGWISDPYECPKPEVPLPVLYFHGTGDLIVPYEGSTILGFPPVKDYMAMRLRLNGIDVADQGYVSYSNGTVTCTSHGSAKSNTTFCRIEGTGHSWPGSKWGCPSYGPFACNHDIDASEQIWAFFQKHVRIPTPQLMV